MGEARAAYRRVVALFHPDRLQGMRAEVRAEGERRLREATEAIEAIRARSTAQVGAQFQSLAEGIINLRPMPGAGVAEAVVRTYNAQVRSVDDRGLHADWSGPHAAAVWTALHEAHTVDGPVHQVEWGAYECTMSGSAVRRLLGAVLVGGDDWRREPLQTFDIGSRRVVGSFATEAPGARDLGWLTEQVDEAGSYLVTAECL
jgi:hypothetical protein